MSEPRITIIRSDRKTLAIQLKNGEIIARAPLRMKDKEIYGFIDSKRSWIEKHLSSMEEKKKEANKYPPFYQSRNK